MADSFFYIFAVPAVLMIGISKGFGGLFVSIAVPLMATGIDPVRAAAILLPILCFADIAALVRFRKNFSRYHIKIMFPGALVGILMASALIGTLSTNAMRLIIGLIAISFCIHHWILYKPSNSMKSNSNRLAGYFWGFVAGFASTQAHAGGPPMSVSLLQQKMDKVTLAGTMVVFVAIINHVKLIPCGLLGQLGWQNLSTSLILSPLVPIGVKIGYWMLHNLEQKTIYRLLYGLLFLSGCKLTADGLNLL